MLSNQMLFLMSHKRDLQLSCHVLVSNSITHQSQLIHALERRVERLSHQQVSQLKIINKSTNHLIIINLLSYLSPIATVHFNHKQTSDEDEAPQTLASELINELVAENKVRISNFYENIFDLIGSNIILPCVNNMKAEIYWLNDDMEEIKGQEPR